MTNKLIRGSIIAVASLTFAVSGFAQTTVTLPDSSQSTTITADVSEQAQVQVPTGVTFNVTNIAATTTASAASVSASNIVLATATKQLKISVQANAASFTPSVGGAATWGADAVKWTAHTWTNGTGAGGTLSNVSYSEVATCAADAAACSTNALVFTLDPNTQVKRSGDHTLAITWKYESIGS